MYAKNSKCCLIVYMPESCALNPLPLLFKRRKYGLLFSSMKKVRNNYCDGIHYLFKTLDARVIP